ncbi:hypothetical protein SKAU_G00125500 [Synaphobranchus kaupii]|uniref:Chromo domain-containing protein n=1 Tax=Synaphobranchus kaupii TaxID=118154 RepID=A0A9Q1FPS1_SYNKA|nr:hypothetical protein SKAU_G00125500 [Synaphobranchus kaupii]
MSVVGGEVFDEECILTRPKKGKFECLVKRRGRSSKWEPEGNIPDPQLLAALHKREQEKEIILHKHGKRPRGRPRKIVEIVPATTESSSSISSPDDDNFSAKKVKPGSCTCETHRVAQKKAQTVVAREEQVKKKHGRKTLPPELRARKLLKNPSKTLPRQPKPDIKKPLLPDSVTGIRRSPRDLIGVQSGQSSSSSGQGQDVFDAECILKRPKKGKVEYLVKRRGRPCKEQEKEIRLHKHDKRPRRRPRKIVELVPTTTESSSSITSPDDDNISAKKVKPGSCTCETQGIEKFQDH